jgi:hypothetical protein
MCYSAKAAYLRLTRSIWLLPRGIGIAQLRDAPPVWSEQFKQLGLPPI